MQFYIDLQFNIFFIQMLFGHLYCWDDHKHLWTLDLDLESCSKRLRNNQEGYDSFRQHKFRSPHACE